MDPLSASASVAAVLQLTATVIKYLNDVKGAGSERQRLLSEICSVNSILYALQDQAEREAEDDRLRLIFTSLQLSDGPLEQFKRTLELLKSKLKPIKGSKTLVDSIIWPFKKDEIKNHLKAIERQKTLLTLARQNDLIALSNAINNNINDVHNELVNLRDGLLQLEEDEEYKSFIAWLNAPDPWINQNKASKLRHKHTGDWFIESTEYKDWLLAAHSPPLWLHGIPGCGKTILASTIIQNLFEYQRIHPQAAVIFYYFDFNDAIKQTYENLIRSLVKQLVSHPNLLSRQATAPYKPWQTQYKEQSESQLMLILHHLLQQFEKVYLVIDALDECKERENLLKIIEQWISWDDIRLHTILASRKERDIEEVLSCLCDDRLIVSIQSTLVDNDIRDYVHARLRDDVKLKRWRNKPQIQQLVVDSLMEKANGMFRWAACQLDVLGDCLTEAKLQKALVALPQTLDETYARILSSIKGEYQDYAFTMLQWLCFSPRPLRLEELAEVVAITSEEPWIHPEERLADPQDVLTICSTLITTESITTESSSGKVDGVDPAIFYCQCRNRINDCGHVPPLKCLCFWPHSGAIDFRKDYYENQSDTSYTYARLAHFSVKEYLASSRIPIEKGFSYRIRESDAHLRMYTSSLAYLLHVNRLDRSRRDLWLEYPLIFHATRYWHTHAQSIERDQNPIPTLALKLALKFLLNEDYSFENWLAMSQEAGPPLHHASRHGLWQSVQMLIDQGVNVDATGGEEGTPIKAAAGHGHDQVVQLLIRHGACVNLMHGYYPLSVAVDSGHRRIVGQLLGAGADANGFEERSSSNKRYPLQQAVLRGDEHIVQMLLDHGVDTESWQSALQTGCVFNKVSLLLKLLNHHSIAAQLRYQSIRVALTYAIQKADVPSVRLWLGQINSREIIIDDNGRTPLSYAAHTGQSAILSLFMSRNNVYIEIADEHERTPLSYAAQHGDASAVQMLLTYSDKNIDYADSRGRTPLSYAAGRGPRGHDIVALLLGHEGVHANSQDHEGRTPLSHAAGGSNRRDKFSFGIYKKDVRSKEGTIEDERHQSVVKMLLDHDDTAFKTSDQYGWTPLAWAVYANFPHLVEVLLPYGHQGLDQVDCHGEQLILGIIRRGCTRLVRLLSEQKAIDLKDKLSNDDYARVTLWHAAAEGYRELMILVLENSRLDLHSRDERGGTLISWAAQKGRRKTLGLLLSMDSTTVDLPDNAGRTLLSYVSEDHNVNVCKKAKLLLDTYAVSADLPDANRRAPMSYAAAASSWQLVELLLDKNVDVDRPDDRGRTPLSYAAGESNCDRVLKLIFDKSTTAKDHPDHAGRTPLSYAAGRGLTGAVKFILGAGSVEINTPDKRGLTPLAHAEIAKIKPITNAWPWERNPCSEETVKVLRNYGAYRLEHEQLTPEEASSYTESSSAVDPNASWH